MKSTLLADSVDEVAFIKEAIKATSSKDIETIFAQLPIVSEHDYLFDKENPENGWKEGALHWIPVGRKRGNAGEIQLAESALNPITERAINGMEAIIELHRQRELLLDPSSIAPTTPRKAVERYFGLPPLDQIPGLKDTPENKAIRTAARDLAKHVRVRVLHDSNTKKFAVSIEDDGIGQAPSMIHETLLSLGETTKADKPYLIGIFGHGG